MIGTKTFAILGGDMRQAYLANILAAREDGYNLYALLLDVKLNGKISKSRDTKMILPQSDVIIFPLPLLHNGGGEINAPLSDQKLSFEECLDYINPEAVVLAGKVTTQTHERAMAAGIEIIDYLEREEFSVLNAVPTALYKLR